MALDTRAIDTRTRPQQSSMHFLPNDQVAPHFTNPWSSQDQMNDAASNLHSLAKPTIRTSSVSSPFLNATSTALASSGSVRSMPSGPYPNPNGLIPNMNGQPAFTTADMSMPGSTAPSPTTAGAAFMPPFSASMDLPVQPRSHYPDRRLSQPAMPTSMYFQADMVPKQRQASLTDIPYRSARDNLVFSSDAMDSARGMVVMSQPQQRMRTDGSQSYPHTHSASSSISSTHSFPYYHGGSVDSSSTEYSDNTSFPSDQLMRQGGPLARTSGYVTSAATVPNQMMTTFSSKITTSTQKKHKCKVCDKRFTRPSSLQTHTYSHTGEKPFVCEQQGCGRRFSVVSNLRRHKKVHQSKNHGT